MSPLSLQDARQARVFIGVLVEKLGGVVTITEDEINKSLTANGGTLYVEINQDQVTIEVFPRGYNAHG